MQWLKQKPSNLLSRRSLCRRSDLQTADQLASLLKSRSVIRFAGPDTIKFLQGLLTNDVRKFEQKSFESLVTPNLAAAVSPPIYAALLTPQGRFLYDFFLYKPAMEEDKLDRTGSGPGSELDKPFEIFADVDSSVLDELLTSLRRYRLRSKVEIDNVGEELSCWQRFGGKLSESSKSSQEMEEPDAAGVGWGSGADRTAAASSHGNGGGWPWFNDPRLDCLGFRGIFPANTTPPLVEADKETEEENYVFWRVENGVAEGSIEIPKGEAIPHEYNLVGLNAISFNKGCYVGQELVARTHHRGVIRKRLLPLRFLNHNGEEVMQKVCPRSEIVDPESGKKVGNVTMAIGSRGLGIVRLEEALKSSSSLGIKGQEDVKVEASKPDWWPDEWSQHYHQHTALA